MPYELSKEAAERARREFQRVLDAAVPAYELGQLRLFHDADENYIRREVERKLFEPSLPNAGDKERKVVKRLKEMSYPDYWKGKRTLEAWASDGGQKNAEWLCRRASLAAAKWSELLPRDAMDHRRPPKPNPGRYYILHALTPKADKFGFKWLEELKSAAMEAKEWDVKWFAKLMLDGLPEPVSDFRLDVLCGIERWNGEVLRVVRLRNIVGEEKDKLMLPAEDFKSPEQFRAWCLGQGNFHSKMNQQEVQSLQEDTGRRIMFRIVKEVDACGWHPLPAKKNPKNKMCEGIWFFDECAFYNGEIVRPDAEGIFWFTIHDGESAQEEGFFLTTHGRENSEFMQDRPKMRPDLRIKDCDLKIAEWKEQPAGKKDEDILRAYFREVCRRLNESIGGLEGNLGVGAMLSYAAAPEIFAQRKQFPGLFVHGQMQSGKGTLTEWLVSLQGFSVSAGTGNKATPVGILQQAQNYSNLVVWIDEFRENAMQDIVPVLRDAFNRQTSPKWTPPDGIHRKIRTMFVVSGETTVSDAATRSRYSHIQVSQAKRKAAQERGAGDHFPWFTYHKQYLFLLWRYVMENREVFVQNLQVHLTNWLRLPALAKVGDRDKIAHGIHFASWMALGSMLESHDSAEVEAFERMMIEHTKDASADVTSESYVNVFLGEIITGTVTGAIPLECFRIKSSYREFPPGRPEQKTGWNSFELYLDYDAVFAALQMWLTKQRGAVTLKKKDLRDQLSKERGWIEGPLQMRFGKEGERKSRHAWGLRLDEHPMGYQQCDDAVFAEHFTPANVGQDPEPLSDPRKGPLYTLVELIQARDREEARKQSEDNSPFNK